MDVAVKQRMARTEDRDRWWPAARRRIIAALLQRFLPHDPARRILEVGCGPGWNLPLLSRFGNVSAVDPDPMFVTFASRFAGAENVACGAVPDAEAPDVDMICMLDVLEHVEDDEAAVAWCRDALPKGGYLCITVPAYDFLWSAHDVESHHYRRYTMGELKRLLDRDFEIAYSTYFNFWLLPLAAGGAGVRRVMRPLSRLLVSRDEVPATFKNSRIEKFFGYVLFFVFASEQYLVRLTRLPFGVSAFVLARRAG